MFRPDLTPSHRQVTYGYTSATFSGRMPCVEVADAIVQTGRETLEKVERLFFTSDIMH